LYRPSQDSGAAAYRQKEQKPAWAGGQNRGRTQKNRVEISAVDRGGCAEGSGVTVYVDTNRKTCKKSEGGKLVDVILTDMAINPLLYGTYNFKLGPVMAYAGGFAGHTYCSYSYSKHQIPYAALLGGGTTIGQSAAVQGDLAVSHQFIIGGIQAPIYLTRLFSLTPGIKYPFVFEATGLQNLRVTVGASTRF
jgi:hypothetical protein